jgi:dipeptidyl aminopeptidase/acylaminoacyl peptidase
MTNKPLLLGYGAWRSSITSDAVAADTVTLSQLRVSGFDAYWVESRPWEAGRSVLVAQPFGGQPVDVTPPTFDVRTRVHEYGGLSYVVCQDEICFSHFPDQQLYSCARRGGSPQRLTSFSGLRFADAAHDNRRQAIFAVCEDHTASNGEPANYLGRIDLRTRGRCERIVDGGDFYASPRLSPDGETLAWLTWNHPLMPWDGAELWVGAVSKSGGIASRRRIAGGSGESVYQPEWSPDGVLHFVSDPKGWWNIYRWNGSSAECVSHSKTEFGRPLWNLGTCTYGFTRNGTIICCFCDRGVWKLGRIDPNTNIREIRIPYTAIFDLQVRHEHALLIAGAPTQPTCVLEVDIESGSYSVLKAASSVVVPEKHTSLPEPIEFPATEGRTAHALFYPPKNDDHVPFPDELPPLLVSIHGGPTSAHTSARNLHTQFFTSRGFAVLELNHSGSSGYGREYRERLRGQWGILEVEEATLAVAHLASRSKADPSRVAIRGGSAGGFTALSAVTFAKTFRAAISLYGVSDLERLVLETHKFESRYLFSLIADYPKHKALYYRRSPLYFAKNIEAPVMFFQGEDDRVVPRSQTESMAQAMLDGSKLFGLLLFAGEQHGFRRSRTLRRVVEAELQFLSVILTKTGLRE